MEPNREKIIVRTSIIGIIANVLLAAFKAFVGMMSNSVAVIMDAVNNLSDALSSVITIIGTKLAGKKPDKKHPLGYGRIEYLSATIISVIVLYAGITSLTESVKKIIHPETPDYSAVSLLIIAVAVGVKIILALFVKKQGKNASSDSLVASGEDALFDAIISASTLAAAVIYLLSGVSLEAWLGAVISVVIVKSGVELLRDTLSQILGERIDAETARKVKETIGKIDGVEGVYDLVLHSYGPTMLVGSVHVQVPDTMTMVQLDQLERRIFEAVLKEDHVLITGVSIYCLNTSDQEASEAELSVRRILNDYPEVLQMHGFFLDPGRKVMQFDIIISFDTDREKIYSEILDRVKKAFPDYDVRIQLDLDISD